MGNSETIPVYSTSLDDYNEYGKTTAPSVLFDETVAKDKNGNIIGIINKEELAVILKTSKCIRELNAPQYYYTDSVAYEIRIVTNKGPLYIVIGHEKSFCYRDGAGSFKYKICDNLAVLNRISQALQ